MLGQIVRWTASGIEIEADPKHRRLILEHLGFKDFSRGQLTNGEAKLELEQWHYDRVGKCPSGRLSRPSRVHKFLE